MAKMRVLIAEGHHLLRAGLRLFVESIPDVEVVAEADSGARALEMVAKHHPDVAMIDISTPGMNGLETTVQIFHGFPETKVVILSMHSNEEYVRRVMQSGARGYLLKDADPAELRIALETVCNGEIYLSLAASRRLATAYLLKDSAESSSIARLSPRMCDVLRLLAEGHRTRAIAQILKISVRTVESHRAHLMEELNIHDLPGLVKYAIRVGLISIDP
jgi:DNA-binding NarL/FixJ family response regulator